MKKMKDNTNNSVRNSITAILFATIIIASFLAAVPSVVSATIDRPFDYTITATGTEDITTYPDQEFTWTVTTTGTETWTEYGFLGSRGASIGGYNTYNTFYLTPPTGSTITDWTHTVHSSSYGGRDAGTYIDTTNNRLVIRVCSGGYTYYYACGSYCCGWNWWGGCTQWCTRWCTGYVSGYYSATYRIHGDTLRTTTATATQSGSGTVNAIEGDKFIASFSLAAPPPQHGGTVTSDSFTITDDNPNVAIWMVIGATGQVRASTDYSETVTQGWSDTETGSSSVNLNEGDKCITTSTLEAPNHDTSWSVSDNSDYVDTWMDGNKLYARAKNQLPIADANGPYVENEGSAVTFDAADSSDPDGDALQYRWDFNNDGTWNTGWSDSPTASYIWDDDWSDLAKVEVSDGELTDTATASVTVNNVAPTVEAGDDQTVIAGCTVWLSGSFTDPGADMHTIEWDFGNGGTATGTLDPTQVYANAGVYTVTLTVTDDDGGVGSDSSTINVNYNICWLPPITTKEEFQLKNGSTLPIKFNATNSNNEFVSDSTVKVKVIDSEGTWQTFVYGEGRDFVRIDTSEPSQPLYICNLHTRELGMPLGEYTIEVSFNGVFCDSIGFTLVESGAGKGKGPK